MTSTTPPPVPAGSKAAITLTGPAATLLFTLVCRLYDSQQPNPILNDRWASYVAEQIDYDYNLVPIKPTTRDILVQRSLHIDRWTEAFLTAHRDREVTVLHLACGLDTRAHRLERGANVRWIDLDLPDVVELRRKLLPEPGGDYTLLSGSALDEEVIRRIPNDRPTVVVAEGLAMYLERSQLDGLVQSICDHFSSRGGELIFDAMSPGLVELQKWSDWLSGGTWMRSMKTGFVSGIADVRELEGLYPGLKLRENVPWTAFENDNPTTGHRVLGFLNALPLLPQLDGFNLRFTF